MTTGTLSHETPLKGANAYSWRNDTSSIWERFNVVDRLNDELVYERTFVLMPDRDPHAMNALMAYAESIKNDNPSVATQIWDTFPDTTT
jgi:hypothetical protein